MRKIINVISTVVILAFCMCLSSCSKPQLSDDEKCSAVCEIADTCLRKYSDGKCEKEKDIDLNRILRWSPPDSKIRAALKKDGNVKYYYAVVLDEKTVLVGTDSQFQSAYGYLITDRSYEVPSVARIYERSNFDGNRINIETKVKDGVYTFSAGL